ncbi:MAG: 3-oxoacyl-ACP synthase III family protein [Flavobacteriaceae bacterium]|nr:3-oxoacyl-ACP synthase III family protein [Flavobacteriaceae bacterium]
MNVRITGTGSYIPKIIKKNNDFSNHEFYNNDGSTVNSENSIVINKLEEITGINERRYANDNLNSSDLGYLAAKNAIENAKIDKETIDYIILAHNFGDVKSTSDQSDMLPCLAARVKHLLGIKNPKCVAYDILFGCPGWVEGIIQANSFIKSGIAKKCLVIGSETLSRVVDKYDRDSMIYADGAGATILEKDEENIGIISHESASFTNDEIYYLFFGESYNNNSGNDSRFIKMHGRKIYEFALTNVPAAMKSCLDNSGYEINELKKIFIHQANEKMDEAIIKRFYRLYKMQIPENIMPMNIHKLGNSSVATVPTLFDQVRKGNLKPHKLSKGDLIMFASVGAGMHINAVIYKY